MATQNSLSAYKKDMLTVGRSPCTVRLSTLMIPQNTRMPRVACSMSSRRYQRRNGAAKRYSRVAQYLNAHHWKGKQNGKFLKPGEALEFFRRSVRRVIICMNWTSLTNQDDNGLEQHLKTFNDTAKKIENLLHEKQMKWAGTIFYKNDFIPKKEVCLGKNIEEILTLQPESRTKEQVALTVAALQSVATFSEYPQHLQEKLCRVAWFQRIPAKKVIVRQGHQGLNFYFVICGKGVIKVVRQAPDGSVIGGETIVHHVENGSSFGNIALSHGKERTATVESVTEMDLLLISREDFSRIFTDSGSTSLLPGHISFLRSVNAMKDWPFPSLLEAYKNCSYQYFKAGKLVVADSRTSDYLYIIKSGTCEIIKQLQSVKPQEVSTLQRITKVSEEVKKLYSPTSGYRPKPTVPTAYTLPPLVNKALLASKDHDERIRILETLYHTRQKDPMATVDLPTTITNELSELAQSFERSYQKSLDSPIKPKKLSVKLRPPSSSCESDAETIADDEEYTIIKRTRKVSRQRSLAFGPDSGAYSFSKSRLFSTSKWAVGIKEQSSENAAHRIQDSHLLSAANREKASRTDVDNSPTLSGVSKNKLLSLTDKWRLKATQKNSSMQAEMLQEIMMKMGHKSECKKFLWLNNDDMQPEIVNEPLIMSHEVKEQPVQSQQSSSRPSTFVRLGLLRSKDVFGLDTLDIDSDFNMSETSVCLVSRGAEVLIISKKFFLKHMTDNLAHLKTLILPYPNDQILQANLQVTANWQLYRKDQFEKVLTRLAQKDGALR